MEGTVKNIQELYSVAKGKMFQCGVADTYIIIYNDPPFKTVTKT